MRGRFGGAVAAFAFASGCALVSGVNDLEVEPDSGKPLGDGSTGETSSGSSGSSGGPKKDASVGDATDDGPIVEPPLPPSRLRYSSFEGKSTTGPLGVDALTGNAALVTTALKGSASLRIETGSARVTFASRPEIWISVLVARSSAGIVTSYSLGGGQSMIVDLVTSGNNKRLAVRVRFNDNVIGTSNVGVEPGNMLRIGLHLKQGTIDGQLDVWAAAGNVGFGVPFVTFAMTPFLDPFDHFDFGEATAQTSSGLVVDEIQVDDAAMP